VKYPNGGGGEVVERNAFVLFFRTFDFLLFQIIFNQKEPLNFFLLLFQIIFNQKELFFKKGTIGKVWYIAKKCTLYVQMRFLNKIGHSKTGSWHLGFHPLILLFDWKTALGNCWKGVAETKIIITLLSYFNGYINCWPVKLI